MIKNDKPVKFVKGGSLCSPAEENVEDYHSGNVQRTGHGGE